MRPWPRLTAVAAAAAAASAAASAAAAAAASAAASAAAAAADAHLVCGVRHGFLDRVQRYAANAIEDGFHATILHRLRALGEMGYHLNVKDCDRMYLTCWLASTVPVQALTYVRACVGCVGTHFVASTVPLQALTYVRACVGGVGTHFVANLHPQRRHAGNIHAQLMNLVCTKDLVSRCLPHMLARRGLTPTHLHDQPSPTRLTGLRAPNSDANVSDCLPPVSPISPDPRPPTPPSGFDLAELVASVLQVRAIQHSSVLLPKVAAFYPHPCLQGAPHRGCGQSGCSHLRSGAPGGQGWG
jgi:hypothetical protein